MAISSEKQASNEWKMLTLKNFFILVGSLLAINSCIFDNFQYFYFIFYTCGGASVDTFLALTDACAEQRQAAEKNKVLILKTFYAKTEHIYHKLVFLSSIIFFY